MKTLVELINRKIQQEELKFKRRPIELDISKCRLPANGEKLSIHSGTDSKFEHILVLTYPIFIQIL